MKKKLNSKERRKIRREEEREKKKIEQILKNAYSRPLPFQWIPKFNGVMLNERLIRNE